MYRWYLVRGVPGYLVGHPVQGDGTRRFVGKADKAQEAIAALLAAKGPLDLVDRFDDVEAIVHFEYGDSVWQAMQAGELEQLAGPVVAHEPALARQLLDQARGPVPAAVAPIETAADAAKRVAEASKVTADAALERARQAADGAKQAVADADAAQKAAADAQKAADANAKAATAAAKHVATTADVPAPAAPQAPITTEKG